MAHKVIIVWQLVTTRSIDGAASGEEALEIAKEADHAQFDQPPVSALNDIIEIEVAQ